MRISENRIIACVVLVVCVLVSVFGFGGMALSRERSKVLTVYDRGTDPSLSVRHSMDSYLDGAADAAGIMASEAKLVLDSTQSADSVEALAAQVGSEEDLDARYAVYESLKTEVEKLYNAVYAAAKGDAFTNFKVAYNDFWGYDDQLKRDDYHKLAYGYNALTHGFPGGLVSALTGQGELNTFGG